VQTLLELKVIWVEFLLFPAMAGWAAIFKGAAILVRSDEVLCVPIFAHVLRVAEDRRFSSIVLPVVRVNADISFVIIFSVGAPYCLEMEDVEIHVRLELFNEFDRKFTLVVSERAKLTVLTHLGTV
jgi:hypothetical protein